MAENSYGCSVYQGFNFQKDSQDKIGHIVALSIGGNAITADLTVTDPTSANMSGTVKVVGVVSGIQWGGGYADPIQFSCQVSTTSKNSLATLQHQSMSNTEVEVQFNIYDYDPDAKVYFKCFHTNDASVKGLVAKSGGSLEINITMDQSMEVVNPKNYSFYMGVMPQPTAQDILMAVSNTSKFAKKWGVTVG